MKQNLLMALLGLVGLVGVLLLASCGGSEANDAGSGPKNYPYKVTVTVGMITDVVRNIVGEHAEVEGLIGEGLDPHSFLPTTPDLKALRSADLVFYNGLMLEGKMGDVLVKVGRKKPVHAVTDKIQSAGGYVMTDEADHFDPHVWMDVAGWMKAVEVVEAALTEFDPKHRDDYEKNARAYLEELKGLDRYARESFATIPKAQRVLVTAHDAFGYMARAYGLEVRGVQGISTEAKAGVRDIEELVDFLVEREIPVVFVESSVLPKSVAALVEGAQSRGWDVKIGGELYSDAMGEEGTYEGTYIGMIDHNVTLITRALGGVADARGMNGKLTPSASD